MAKPAKSKKSSPAKPAKKAAKAKPAAKSKKPAAKPKAKAQPKGALKRIVAALVGKGKAATKPAAKAKPGKPVAQAKPVAPAKPAKPVAPAKPAKPVAPSKSAKPATPAKPAKVAVPAKPEPKPAARSTTVLAGKRPAGAAPKLPFMTPPAMPAPRPIQKPTGPKAVAVVSVKAKPEPKMSKKAPAPIKVKGTEVVRVRLPANYKPLPNEQYMNANQIEYFRQKLLTWRTDLVEESKQTIDNLREEVRDVGDEAERASRETENSLELRTRDRYRKLISKIDKALRRIEDGEYGYCEETGEEIGLERLEARPIATLCLDAQERWEHRQRQMGD